MDEVALAVQHDVAIVSVLYLQQEEQQAVSSHTADEVVPCLQRVGESVRKGNPTCKWLINTFSIRWETCVQG